MKFTLRDAEECLKYLKVKKIPFTLQSVRDGMNVELEHGTVNRFTNITNDDPILTCKIALAHLLENPNYYTKLKQLDL